MSPAVGVTAQRRLAAAVVAAAAIATATAAAETVAAAAAQDENQDDDPPAATETIVTTHDFVTSHLMSGHRYRLGLRPLGSGARGGTRFSVSASSYVEAAELVPPLPPPP